jgi:hypothetical protein
METIHHPELGLAVEVHAGLAGALRRRGWASGPLPSGPPKSAPKAEWVDHAVLSGADRADAEASTKEELIAAHT